ncbi:MAG: gamma-glutamyltransferase family protein [Pseudomonadota bacterium]
MAVLPFTTRPEIQGRFGVVASTHWIATAVGMGILERGGNAFDAACAAGFALQVAEPHLNGPGGEMPAIFQAAHEDAPRVICAQGTAPALATIEAFRDRGLATVPGSGLLPAVVPGAFDGWMRLLMDFGTMPLRTVLEPAIAYAEQGVPVLPKIHEFIRRVTPLFNDEWQTSAAVYLDQGKTPPVGAWLANPKLAATYRRIIDEAESAQGGREAQIEAARRAWYEGFVAEAIDRFYTHEEVLDSSGSRHKGLLRGADMAAWRASYEAPVTTRFGDYEVAKCGFWSQGPAMLQQLAMLRAAGVEAMDPVGDTFVHTVCEVAKLAFADREAWYADPAFTDVPQETLLSDAYAQARFALVDDAASMTLRPGSPEGRAPDIGAALNVDGSLGEVGHYFSLGEPTVQPTGESRGDTVHIDIIDREGNMIALTPSGGWLQSAPVIPELGFCISVRGQMFWIDDQAAAKLEPGKRPRTTLSPSFASRDGKPYLAWGTPGGDQQDQWSTLLFLHHVCHGMNLQEAIDTPAFHSEHFPSSFWPRAHALGKLVVEGRFRQATIEALKARGHGVNVGDDWSEGRLTACAKDGAILKAAANPRGMQGYAAGR